LFVLFLFAGYYKADPRFASVQARVDITVLFALLSFSVLACRFARGRLWRRVPRASVRMLLLFILLCMCLLGGVLHPGITGYGFDKAVRFVVLTGWAVWGAALVITDQPSLKRFTWAVAAVGTAMAIDALVGTGTAGAAWFVTAFGSNYIALARATGLGLITVVTFLLPLTRRHPAKVVLLGMIGVQLLAAARAGARGPVAALALALLLFVFTGFQLLPVLRVERFTLRFCTAALAVVFVVGGILQRIANTLVQRMLVLVSEGGISALTRLEYFSAAMTLWATSPLWGVGTGAFALSQGAFGGRLYPHNIVLELGTETGLIGAGVFAAMIWVAFERGLHFLRRSRAGDRFLARYLLVATAFLLFNALVSGDINDNRMLFVFLALLSGSGRFLTTLMPARNLEPTIRVMSVRSCAQERRFRDEV